MPHDLLAARFMTTARRIAGNAVFDDARACGCRAAGNNVYLNADFGLLSFGSGTGYSNNVISAHTGGTVSGGVDLCGNLCDSSTTCP